MLNKFSGNDANKPFHSHTFADAASGSSMGATSAQTFGQRHQIDQNRQMVRRYSESSVASTGERLRDELYRRMDEAPSQKHAKHKYRATRQGFNAGEASAPGSVPGKPTGTRPMQIPKRSFSEPPSRKYNPFG